MIRRLTFWILIAAACDAILATAICCHLGLPETATALAVLSPILIISASLFVEGRRADEARDA